MTILDAGYRRLVLSQIKQGENKYRKDKSWKQYRVMSDDYSQYVVEKLAGSFDIDTVLEMPRIASINIANKIVQKTAVVYKKAPTRTYTGVSDADTEVLNLIHVDGKFNKKLRASNKSFKYQNQNLIQIIPKRGKLTMKSLKLHQYDVIPMDDDPEEAKTIILSVNERQNVDNERIEVTDTATGHRGASETNARIRDFGNEEIADEDDYKASLEKYIVWDLETKTNFLMDGNGKVKIPSTGEFVLNTNLEQDDELLSEFIIETDSLPFIDASTDKDFTYFIRKHHSVTDFTIDFNAALSDYADTNHMQSKAQAIIKGPANLLANEVKIGSHIVLKLVKQFDEEGREIDMDFSYVNPSPDMAGAKEFIESLLALYLSSRDIDSGEVTMSPSGDRYSSGFERFLAIFETFSASQEDFDIYDEVENEKLKIIRGWINVAKSNDGVLAPEYITTSNLAETKQITEFNKPEELKSKKEALEEFGLEKDLGVNSRVKFISKRDKVSEDQARIIIAEIDKDELGGVEEPEVQNLGGLSDL